MRLLRLDSERSRHPRSWPRRLLSVGATASILVAVALVVIPRVGRSSAQRFTKSINPELASSPSTGCQPTPPAWPSLNVGYTSAWQSPSGPFVVIKATVGNLDPACDGATLTVSLYHGATSSASIGTGSTTVGGPSCTGTSTLTCTVTVATPPAASLVNNVSMALTTQVVNGNLEVTSANSPYLCNGLTINGNVTVDSGGTFDGNSCTINGNLTSAGTVSLSASTVTGNVQTSAGPLTLASGTSIQGNVQPNGGGPIQIGAGAIGGNLQFQNLTSTQGFVCGTRVGGSLTLQSSSEPFLIGSPSSMVGSPASSCAGNPITKNLTVQSDSGSVTIEANTVGGNIQVQNNSGQLTIGSGTATSGAPSADGNKAQGNIQVQNNTNGSPTSTMGGNWAGDNCNLSGDNKPIIVPSASPPISYANYARGSDKCQASG